MMTSSQWYAFVVQFGVEPFESSIHPLEALTDASGHRWTPYPCVEALVMGFYIPVLDQYSVQYGRFFPAN